VLYEVVDEVVDEVLDGVLDGVLYKVLDKWGHFVVMFATKDYGSLVMEVW
jgi:hypothetical protein